MLDAADSGAPGAPETRRRLRGSLRHQSPKEKTRVYTLDIKFINLNKIHLSPFSLAIFQKDPTRGLSLLLRGILPW